MTTHPHRIEPIIVEERRRSRNCLRVDYISDGVEPRCNLRPKDDDAAWVLENRPHHLREHITMFDYCINRDGCEGCRIYKRAQAEIQEANKPFIHVPIIVRRHQYGFEVVALGACTWYAIHHQMFLADINVVAAWVKERGGALGPHGDDPVHGRHRTGFVNGFEIARNLWPPCVERAAGRL